MDTGARNHFTSVMEKLHMRKPYHGKEDVHTADGSGMCILHVGPAIIPTSSSRLLYLRNILHVPAITKNLLSVNKIVATEEHGVPLMLP